MRTFCVIVLIAVLAGCGRPASQLKDVLPVEVQRIWTLKQTTNVSPEQGPELLRSLAFRRALESRYEGNGTITVKLFEMNVEASAFELI